MYALDRRSEHRHATDLTVAAVVVNHNGGERVVNTVRALLEQQTPLREVIVVDNASTDGSVDRIREAFDEVDVLDMGENAGLPAARNAGLRLTHADLVLLIDNDVYVSSDCIDRMIRAYLELGEPAVVCPRIILLPEEDVVQADGAAAHFVGTMMLRHAYRPVADLADETSEVGGCIGACMLLDRQRVLDAGGFDEAYFFYFEDLEFSLRMRSLGHRFVCESAAVVYHDRGRGTPGLSFRGKGEYPLKRATLTLRHRLMTMLIHYRVSTLLLLSPALAVYEFASMVMAIAQGWGGAWLRAWAWQVRHWRRIATRRRQMQRDRKRGDRDLLMAGPLPLTPGLVQSPFALAAVNTLSTVLTLYWQGVRRLVR